VEINVKGTWKNMGMIYKEIDLENTDLQNIRAEIDKIENTEKRNLKIEQAGKLVEKALITKKNRETEKILDDFRKSVFEYKLNKTTGDAMFMNTAFLVNSGREVELDNIMAEIGSRHQYRSDFVYTAPLPVFNFIDLKIFPEKWEL
jgi:hypothetical protein